MSGLVGIRDCLPRKRAFHCSHFSPVVRLNTYICGCNHFCIRHGRCVFPQAPSEAEAQCASLAREGVVYGTATEDMDALTFQTPKLLRRMTFSGASQPILEVDYQKLLQVRWSFLLLERALPLLLDVHDTFRLADRGASVMNQPAPAERTVRVQGLELSHEKFIDLCVLCGCDYTGSIKGIGPKKALALVRQVRSRYPSLISP